MTVASARHYRGLSLWLDYVDDDLTPRAQLDGDQDVDVAIVGAGFTGLWTAYALLQKDPTLSVLLLEREIAGFGASGRNGGWCSDLFPVPWARLARRHGRAAANAMHRAMVDGIADIAATLDREGVEADMLRGGQLKLARTSLQEAELRDEVAHSQRRADADLALCWLDAGDVAERIRVTECRGAAYTPNCARIHPAKLVRGLARAVERLGGRIAEQTTVLEVQPHRALTSRGTVRAKVVVRATEAYTATLRGERRALLPLYSLMIGTAPLSSEAWAEIGWARGETVNDGRHLLIYAQRTADDRIAFGGRGAPYHYGSRICEDFDREPVVFRALEEALHDLVPQTRGVAVTHRWGGPIGVARDWNPSVGIDRSKGLAWAGGYVGDGVTAANVAGRTLADLILDRESPLIGLPWVQHHSRRWEPEPLRWLGVNTSVRAMRGADDVERRTGRRSWRARAVTRLQGG
ncbi:MAG: FAD-dependent oxidoreductase [Candidatus Dormibacteraeota bacterium]|uniref:FAD-dependent oxidoreductase n=1 Tax=Candidatus Aeolococcus gillhamiae TaxID=3127015 RepID=A0A2W5ZGR9_9BACT|nr:FAD-dependent oxidoreductase [Candidatus Dormibacteraeota bacterium]PZR82205.1 MAG: FAD-dependent oxidoreductase [Candidatus Dormibacter sp. RRmetagenome_bin12]